MILICICYFLNPINEKIKSVFKYEFVYSAEL